ncbi:hypothetical protein [Saccharopolyspora taberi]|uniref:ASCH domain-containing protein n=1 Tax=Saccharopolyspora taberi TaxID=60895 RepID=A0ABN3VF18_9PSEU
MPNDVGANLPGDRVLMSLKPEYYELMWEGLKTHEFRRRYLKGQPTTWYVYLTAPVSKLTAVINLDEAVVGSPRSLADIAERANPGSGKSVYAYLEDVELAHAMPIRMIREYPGFTADQLAVMLDGFQAPQGYTLIDKHADWAGTCDRLTQAPVVRELVIQHPV